MCVCVYPYAFVCMFNVSEDHVLCCPFFYASSKAFGKKNHMTLMPLELAPWA